MISEVADVLMKSVKQALRRSGRPAEPVQAKKRQVNFDLRFRPAGGMRYLAFFQKLHDVMNPDWYFEIGTCKGGSLQFSKCASVSVDPQYRVASNVMGNKPQLHMFQQTSDDVFGSDAFDRLGMSIDFAFLDGMHLVEYLVRDVMNTERYMADQGMMFIHDTRPLNLQAAAREQLGVGGWTGDVWKILPILRDYRPDLKVRHLDCRPTGLTLIEGPWGGSTALRDNYDEIEKRYIDMSIEDYGVERFLEEFPLHPPEDILAEVQKRSPKPSEMRALS